MNIYCDGSCWPNPGGNMGVGVFVPLDPPLQDIRFSLFFGINGTNQRAELAALTLGIAMARPGDTVWTDSQYALGMAGSWQAKVNRDLVTLLRNIRREKKGVALRWIRGHAGNIAQEIADELAEKGRKERAGDRYTPNSLGNQELPCPLGACERMAGVLEILRPRE